MAEIEVIFYDGITAAVLVSAIPLTASFVVGVGMALFQAITQLHDQTLSFVPKALTVSLILALFGGWMVDSIVEIFQFNLTTAIVSAARER